jgi:hypothetical protein
MLVTFNSKAGPDIVMFGDVAKRLLQLIGKEPGDQGVVTAEQLPEAIARLKAAIAADKAARVGKTVEELPAYEPTADGGTRPYVNLANRALPLLDLFERSLRSDTPVVWGA